MAHLRGVVTALIRWRREGRNNVKIPKNGRYAYLCIGEMEQKWMTGFLDRDATITIRGVWSQWSAG